MFFGLGYEQLSNIYYTIIGVLSIFLLGMVVYRFSVVNKIREEKIMKKQAYTDPLTSGGNRQLFLKVVDNLISKNKKFALCFLDIDGFKQINDTMGHDAGDELLKKLYTMLSEQLVNNSGTAYRLGGDEFALILTSFETTEDIAKLLDKIKDEIKKPILIENTNIFLEYSLGVSIFPTDADNKKDLLAYADDAMYYIKEHGKNNYYFHNKVLKAKQDNKNKMELDLKKAYIEGQFDVDLQPRINLKDTSIMYFEALVYWNHPVLGYLKAEYFIKQAEELGLIIKLDEFVLEKCCRKLNELKKNGYENVRISVNSSNKHCKRNDFIDNLCGILNNYSFNKGDIQVEFTDIIKISELDKYKTMIDRLKKCGSDICITNLEIDYDSLVLISELPLDEIKLNVQYIREDSHFNINVLKDIIKLSKDLKYNVTITHVETEDELKYVLNNEVDKIQGNYMFKRININQVEDYIQHYNQYRKDIDNIIKKTR